MSRKTYFTRFVLASALYGCAPQPTEPATPADAMVAREAPLRSAPPGAAANVAVAKPAELGAIFRLSSPKRDLLLASRLIPLPPDAHAILANPGRLMTIALGPALASLVDLTEPADLLSPVWEKDEEGPRDSVFALTLEDGAAPTKELRAAFRLRPRRGGAIALEPMGDQSEVGLIGSKIACELWTAPAGDARGRLVCASDPNMLPTYAPYAARGMKDVATSASLWMEFGPAMFRQLIENEERELVRAGDGPDNVGEVLGKRFVIDFIKDWAASGMGISLKAGYVELSYEQTFQSSRSTATVLACADPTAPTPPPLALFRMPADTDMALYIQGAPKEIMRTRGPAALKEFFRGFPADLLPPSAVDEAVDVLRPMLLTGGPLVVAYGQDRRGARAALDQSLVTRPPAWNADIGSDAGLRKARQSMQGWTLIHMNEPFDVWAKGIRSTLKFEERDFFAEKRSAGTPGSRGAGPSAPSSKRLATFVEQPVSSSDALPAGSIHLVKQAKPAPPAKKGARPAVPHEFHVWLAPEGGATWIAWGEDPRLVREKLKHVLASASAKTLEPPLGLASLRGTQAVGMGAVTLAGLVSLANGDKSLGQMVDARERLLFLDTLQTKGQSPIPVAWTSEPHVALDGSQGCRLRFTARLSPTVLGDLVEWVKEFGVPEPADR